MRWSPASRVPRLSAAKESVVATTDSRQLTFTTMTGITTATSYVVACACSGQHEGPKYGPIARFRDHAVRS